MGTLDSAIDYLASLRNEQLETLGCNEISGPLVVSVSRFLGFVDYLKCFSSKLLKRRGRILVVGSHDREKYLECLGREAGYR